ncbi:hypothetical protein B0H13DRAFT_2286804 [Mycena leptocephala]|nr:hypothetical protein B0H13DRAFT_2286804 [Mycena leptocephala]
MQCSGGNHNQVIVVGGERWMDGTNNSSQISGALEVTFCSYHIRFDLWGQISKAVVQSKGHIILNLYSGIVLQELRRLNFETMPTLLAPLSYSLEMVQEIIMSPDKRKHNPFMVDEITPDADPHPPDPPADFGPPSKRAKLLAANALVPALAVLAFSTTKWASLRTESQKIDAILEVIKDQNWAFACFLYNIFRTRDIKGGLIGPVHATLTTFSTQTIGKRVAREVENAVKLTNGLHVSVAVRGGVLLECKIRPPKGVIAHAISALHFCRTNQANLLSRACGILYFGSSAPIELMKYNCRIGNMASYSTIRRTLVGLSDQETATTAAHGKDPNTAGFLFLENCQNQHKRRDLHIGRESVVNYSNVDVAVSSLTDKRARVGRNRRKDVTVDQLLGFIDQEDVDLTGTLLFMEKLMRCVVELKAQHGDSTNACVQLQNSLHRHSICCRVIVENLRVGGKCRGADRCV